MKLPKLVPPCPPVECPLVCLCPLGYLPPCPLVFRPPCPPLYLRLSCCHSYVSKQYVFDRYGDIIVNLYSK